ncbi:MAG: hypothetical protein LUD16_00740 [Lachnospiraceae bacterium]|nr:hypothetical protein [Lachnospiraceae bacterium]
MTGWTIAMILFAVLFLLTLLFVHGASVGRSEAYQKEQDDIQMRCVSRKKQKEKPEGKPSRK